MLLSHPLLKFTLAILLAVGGLEGMKLLTESLSIRAANGQRSNEVAVRGLPSVKSLKTYLEHTDTKSDVSSVLWLGNSQLHSIVDYRPGDYLVNHWITAEWPQHCRPIAPTVVSLPSSNPQEHFILSHFFGTQRPIDLVVIALTFNDFRHDGLRPELTDLFTDEVHSMLSKTATGKTLLSPNASFSSETVSGPGPTASRPIELEEWLSHTVLSSSSLWESRASLKELLVRSLLSARNWTFGISPTDVRKAIRPRYDANMQAFEELLSLFEDAGIPILTYITPIRHDYPLPYVIREYQLFKEEANRITIKHSSSFLDLDAIIPSDLWSSTEPDYMHFKGQGHRLLAAHVLPETTSLVCDKIDSGARVHRRLFNNSRTKLAKVALGAQN